MKRSILAAMALALFAGSVPQVRADYAYAYSTQDIKMQVTAAAASDGSNTLVGGVVKSSGSTFATLSGYGSSGDTAGPLAGVTDPLQAWVTDSGALAPSQNHFYTVAGPTPSDPTPVIPTGTFWQLGKTDANFARADARTTSTDIFGAGFRAINVAESYIDHSGAGSASGNWTISAAFSVGALSKLQFAFDYKNLLMVDTSGATGTADATYKVDISIIDQTLGNAIVFNGPSPLELNHSISSNSTVADGAINHQFDTGFTFVAGHNYLLTITGSEVVHTRAVPEPSSMISLGLGIAGVAGYGWRRRKALRMALEKAAN